jgi:hypothetical protein
VEELRGYYPTIKVDIFLKSGGIKERKQVCMPYIRYL